MLTLCWIQMHIPEQQEVLAFIVIFQKVVFSWPPSHKWHHKQTKIIFRITKFTLSDRIYLLECTYIWIEDILWPRRILRAVKNRAIWWGKGPCSLVIVGKMPKGKFCHGHVHIRKPSVLQNVVGNYISKPNIKQVIFALKVHWNES